MRRRDFVSAGLAALLGTACNRHRLGARSAETPRPHLETAVAAARWIRSSRIDTGHGWAWPADPSHPGPIAIDLYSGSAGVVLFMTELARATGDGSWLAEARAGADDILARLATPDQRSYGLYTGVAGVGFVLHRLAQLSGEERYHRGAKRCVQILVEKTEGDGVDWGPTTDIISGSAGISLFLIYAAHQMKENTLDTARRAGLRLIELGVSVDGGLRWAMAPNAPRLYPNFAHGTAGVSYLLATLYRETGDARFLAAAQAGASYLTSIAYTQGDVCLLYRHEPDARDLYYLGWCHGPAGTGRLFYRLWQATGDRRWMEWLRRSARGVLASGIPETRTPGFWNNVGQCCGSASVGEFFLSLHQVTGEASYLEFARRMTAEILAKAVRDERGGARWPNAEFRVKPEMVVAQTGYMQGAAGVAMWLLRLDAWERGRSWTLLAPDSPFEPRQRS